MVKVAEALFSQPFASVTNTVYVPAVEAEVVCAVPVPLSLHVYELKPAPASNEVDSPEQIDLLLIDIVGNGFIVKVAEALFSQPIASVTNTVYVPAVEADVVCAVPIPLSLQA